MQAYMDEASSTGIHRQTAKRRSRAVRIGVGVMIGVVLGNALGYGAHRMMVSENEGRSELRQQAHRAAGLKAMENGEYEVAVREFSAGLRSTNPDPDLPRLLSIAQNLREVQARQVEREAEAKRRAEDAKLALTEPEAPATEEPKPEEATATARTEVPPPSPEPEPEPEPGLLLVTTTPSHLTIKVDGEIVDLSPARLELEPGQHQVALFNGSKFLYRRRIRIRPGKVIPINREFPELLEAQASATERRSAPAEKLPPPRIISEPDAGFVAEPEPEVTTPEPTPPVETPKPAPAVVKPTPKPQPKKKAQRISQSVLRKVIRKSTPMLRRCYKIGRRVNPYLEVSLSITMEVDASGRVRKGEVKKTSTRAPRVVSCIERALKDIVFPARPGGDIDKVSTRLNFRP